MRERTSPSTSSSVSTGRARNTRASRHRKRWTPHSRILKRPKSAKSNGISRAQRRSDNQARAGYLREKKRHADAERTLQTKTTKRALEDQRKTGRNLGGGGQ